MNSKECLERLLKYANINEAELITKYGYSASNDIETIKQDLDRLEKLEQENNSLRAFVGNLQFCRERETRKIEELEKKNQELLVNKNVAQGIVTKLKEENDKLKKALDKACEKLDYTCIPVEEELVEDLDCDNNCKECWKKYFMKEVLHND